MTSNANYRRYILLAITLIALGVTFSNTMENVKTLGTVLIAVGGLFFIIGMNQKRKDVEDFKK
ncbi:MAG: hypothetical protein KDC80_09235 [Saprospiraceae bacterium]|nr:hypothetical protein [Saprospiraceae bacterium]